MNTDWEQRLSAYCDSRGLWWPSSTITVNLEGVRVEKTIQIGAHSVVEEATGHHEVLNLKMLLTEVARDERLSDFDRRGLTGVLVGRLRRLKTLEASHAKAQRIHRLRGY
jgi:hypothetical protein